MGVLFISHSSLDNVQAIKVRDWLRGQGWGDVFLDLDPSQGLAPGQRWKEELKRAGETCAGVLVLISPDWVKSRWCQTEFLVADQLGKKIFPVFIAPTPFDDLPLELKAKFQLADISTPDKEAEGFARLAVGLKRAGLDPQSFSWPPEGEPNRAVYRGLEALDVQDAAIFFGRDAYITKGLDILRRMRDGAPERLLVIQGASGAGKSSFLRAGLLARLQRDEENFLVLPVLRPERAVLTSAQGLEATLSLALGRRVRPRSGADVAALFAAARAPIMDRLRVQAEAGLESRSVSPPTIILPVDQAEELFTGDSAERTEFCAMLAEGMRLDGDALMVATIRTDSYESLQNGFLPDAQLPFTLPAVAGGSFQHIIQGPASLSNPPIQIEPALVQRLLTDLDAADALPLLAFTLERLLKLGGEDGRLTLNEYEAKLGGLSGAIQSAVASVLGESPSKDALAKAKALFVPALVRVDHTGVKRRVIDRADLPEGVLDLADAFVAQRLLISDQGHLEVAHEAILRQWPALADWINDERAALTGLESVRTAAKEWRSRRTPPKPLNAKSARFRDDAKTWLLHRGHRLKEARSYVARVDFAALVDVDVHEYLKACTQVDRSAASLWYVVPTLVAVFAIMGASLSSWYERGNGAWLRAWTLAHESSALRSISDDAIDYPSVPPLLFAPLQLIVRPIYEIPANALGQEDKIVEALTLIVSKETNRLGIDGWIVSSNPNTGEVWIQMDSVRAHPNTLGGCADVEKDKDGFISDLGIATECAAAFFKASNKFESVDLNYIVRTESIGEMIGSPYSPNDPLFDLQWNLHPQTKGPQKPLGGAGFQSFWQRVQQMGARRVVVGIVDTGIDYTHPDFTNSPNILKGFDMISEPEAANDGDARDGDAQDAGDRCDPNDPSVRETWHGTQIASIVGASNTGNRQGAAGANWNVSILPVRVIGRCGGMLADVTDGIRWAAGLGSALDAKTNTWIVNREPAQIINLSFGLFAVCPPPLQRAIDDAVARGAIIVTAAGNARANTANYAPASCRNVISVAASDARGHLTPYSNWGAEISMMAPGGDLKRDDNSDGYPDGILTARRSASCTDPVTKKRIKECYYAFTSGSSLSAAHVSAALALFKAQNKKASNQDLLKLLHERARKVTPPTSCSGSCELYPGAIPIANGKNSCFRPCGGGLLDLGAVDVPAIQTVSH